MAISPAHPRTRSSGSWRRLAQNLGLSLGVLALACLVLEIGIRWTGAAYDPQYDARGEGIAVASPDPEIRKELPAHFDGLMLGTRVRTNAFGMRGGETTLEKPAGVFRIAVLGDSWAFGWGVGAGEEFPAVLETLLRPGPGGRRVEVLNFSMFAYNTLQELAVLKRKAMRFGPDLVLVAYNVNDVEGLDPERQDATGDAMLREIETSLNTYSHLIRFVDERLRRLALSRGVERSGKVASYQALYAPDSVAWQRVRGALREIRDVAAQGGASTYVVLCPWINVLSRDNPYIGIHRQVTEAAAELGIPSLDLFPVFEGRDAAALRISPLDGHPRAEGHRIAAAAIADDLRRRGLLREPAPVP